MRVDNLVFYLHTYLHFLMMPITLYCGGIACNTHRGSEKPVTPTENTLPLCRAYRVAQPLKASAQTGKSTWQPTWCKQCIQQS